MIMFLALEFIFLNSSDLLEHLADISTFNKLLPQKLLNQGYMYHELRKTFSKFYHPYYDLISKLNIGRRSLLHQGLLEPDLYGDLVYKLKKNIV